MEKKKRELPDLTIIEDTANYEKMIDYERATNKSKPKV